MTWPLDPHQQQDQRLPHQLFTDSQTRSSPLLLHHCVPVRSYNTIIKLDTTIIKFITRNESAYREELWRLSEWFLVNNQRLITTKTTALLVEEIWHSSAPLCINGARVGRVQTSWGFHIRGPLLVGQHHCNFQKKVQEWAIRTAQKRTDCLFLEESAISRYLSRNTKIVQDFTHPGHHLWQVL